MACTCVQRDIVASIGNGLIEQAEGITHTTSSGTRQQFGGSRLQRDLLLLRDKSQVLHDLPRGNALKVETLAARDDGGQAFSALRSSPAQTWRSWAALQAF